MHECPCKGLFALAGLACVPVQAMVGHAIFTFLSNRPLPNEQAVLFFSVNLTNFLAFLGQRETPRIQTPAKVCPLSQPLSFACIITHLFYYIKLAVGQV